jgi:hypothetical protein
VEVKLLALLTSKTDTGEWQESRSGRFTSGERASGTHWIKNLDGSFTSLYMEAAKSNTHDPVGNGGPCVYPVPSYFTVPVHVFNAWSLVMIEVGEQLLMVSDSRITLSDLFRYRINF